MNDTICLVFTPLLLVALRALGVRPLPYLLGLAFASNVGSAMTLTGNPQNMLIGIASGTHYAAFTRAMLLPALGGLVIVYAVIALAYRRDLAVAPAAPDAAASARIDRPLVVKALTLFAGALAGWLAGFPLPLVAIAAGALMIAVAGRDPAEAFAKVEWSLLLFFAALFIVMRGVEDVPLFAGLTAHAVRALHGEPWHDATVVSVALTALSNLVSNVPAVLLWRPVVPHVPNPDLVWLVIAMSSTFAGNLTVLGSMANLIVAERAAARGAPMRFMDFVWTGVPITVLTIAWGIVALVALR